MTVFGFFLPSLKDSFRLLMLRRKKSFLVQQEQGLFLCLRPRRWVSNAQGVFLFGRLHFLKGKKEKHKHYNASSYSIDDCWSSLVLYLLTCLFVSLWYFNFPKEQYCNVTREERSVESSNCREKQQQVLLLICLFSHTVHSKTHWSKITFLSGKQIKKSKNWNH